MFFSSSMLGERQDVENVSLIVEQRSAKPITFICTLSPLIAGALLAVIMTAAVRFPDGAHSVHFAGDG
jgi:hypothetical protein